LDQVHLPDPVYNDLIRLQEENKKLKEAMDQMNERVKILENLVLGKQKAD
jgi:serine O-acetyltransferase